MKKMSDLISKEALIEELKKSRKYHAQNGRELELLCRCENIVNEQPTVEAVPVVHGEWERVGSGSLYDVYECTNCHCQPKWDCLGDNHWKIAFTDFCPNCGADMRKKVRHEQI